MPDARNLLGWLLVGVVGAVGAGAAILGVSQAPGSATLSQAITNTLRAPNYEEVFTESMPEGSETGYLTYQAPDRLGGYIESAGRRTYVYIVGDTQYQSVTVGRGASTAHLVFYRQHSLEPVSAVDPVQYYLRFEHLARRFSARGTTYTVTITRSGQTGILGYQVSGQYIGRVVIEAPQQASSVVVTISQVGTAPPTGLPPGARVVGAVPALPGTTTSPS